MIKLKISLTIMSMSFLMFFGCASIQPSDIEYKEISAADFYSQDRDMLFSVSKGYKITGVQITSVVDHMDWEMGDAEYHIRLGADERINWFDGTDYIKQNLALRTVIKKMSQLNANSKYRNSLVAYVYLRPESRDISNYPEQQKLFDIAGLPTLDEIEAEEREFNILEQQKRNEEKSKIDEQGRTIAGSLIYHGIEESLENYQLFKNNALETGHAYYISNFKIRNGGGFAGAAFDNSVFVPVTYINQKVKGEVVLDDNMWGSSVIVTVGQLGVPVVLGLIRE